MVHEIFTPLDTFIGKCYEDLLKNIDCALKTIGEANYNAHDYKTNITKLDKYKDILRHMKMALEFNSEKHTKIVNEIEKEIDERNIGRGMYYMLDEINEALTKTPPRCSLASSRISLIIHLLKIGYNVIPVFTRTDIIKRLNSCIEHYNKMVPSKNYQGKIIQLQPYSNFIYDTKLFITWKCNSCNKIWEDKIVISLDVFTPICKYCNSIDVNTHQDNNHESHHVNVIKKNKI